MARSLTAFMQRNKVPLRAALQEAISALDFKLTVESDYVPFECTGYLPFTLDGEDAGFNIRFDAISSDTSLSPKLKTLIGDRDVAINLRWGGDARERASALIFAAVMAKSFSAIIHAVDEDTVYQPEKLLGMVRETLESLF